MALIVQRMSDCNMSLMPVWIVIFQEDYLDDCKKDTVLDL